MAPKRLILQRTALPGHFVHLEPYADANREEVRQALDCDAEAWQVFASSGQGEHFDAWWASAIQQMQAGHRLAFAIRDRASGKVVGTTSFLNLKAERQTVEIGATFLHPSVRAGHTNPECKLLMLQYAFAQGARRVELLTDLRNVRSQAAIAKLGAVREGVLRRDRITWTGHVRDSVLFSITDLDWPDVQDRLTRRLQALGWTAPQA